MAASAAPSSRTAIGKIAIVAEGELGADAQAALAARGIACARVAAVGDAGAAKVVAFAPSSLPALGDLHTIAAVCRETSERDAIVVVLASCEEVAGAAARDRAIALAHLSEAGAIVTHDPESWLEAVVLVASYDLPAGPRLALIAPPGSYVAHAALALAAELALTGQRGPAVFDDTDEDAPAEVVLADVSALVGGIGTRATHACVIPVCSPTNPVSVAKLPALAGLRAAIAATTAVGRFAQLRRDRLASDAGTTEVERDEPRFARQLENVGDDIGDHEAKVLLASYGVPVIRQAVATTPSAAARIAKKAGYPVEMKPWGPDAAAEHEGCPVERDLQTAADVRRAYAALMGQFPRVGPRGDDEGVAMIVRETPPDGREVSARFAHAPELGWVVVVESSGMLTPLAATLPLSPASAHTLAASLVSSRIGEPPPDREALAGILLSVSTLLHDHPEVFDMIELGRIVVTPPGDRTVVIDARARRR